MTPEVTTDLLLDIAIGKSRREKHWKNVQLHWSDLLERLRTPHRTAETHAEYMKATKARQDEIKDVGGFVGGLLTGGRRKPEAVLHRSILTLDLDTAPKGFWEDFTLLYDCAACIYSTHKHSPDFPRLRLLIPFSRVVNPCEYEAIGRRIAGELGIEAFDHSGFQPYRLMYWPSCPVDGEYVFKVQEGELLDVDSVLSTYQDYTDSSQWPVSAKVGKAISRGIDKQGDPHEKRGIIGAFCRCYTISEVIEKYLPDVYDLTDHEDRYTYRMGSTAGGLVVYNDKFAYSHHGTDPISGKLCNGFDLVRIHLFGMKDEDSRENGPVTKLPSYKAMVDLCRKDEAVKLQIGRERIEEAKDEFKDFSELGDGAEDSKGGVVKEIIIQNVNRAALGIPKIPEIPVDDQWLTQLEIDQTTAYKSTISNVVIVLRNDPNLRGRIAFNSFRSQPCVIGDLPWQRINEDHPLGRFLSDSDTAGLRYYLENVYGIYAPYRIKDALSTVWTENTYHPIRNYLGGLKWDKVERLNRVLVDFFGAEDNEYTAAVGRKWFTAAVARVYNPGCKFDYMLTLVGVEGIYKSTFFNEIADPWFTDNFSFHMIGSPKAAEQISGYWIVEAAELTGMKKAEVEGIKAFVARRKDIQRGAYKEYVKEAPRQNIFAGSTNEDKFLRGTSGNRRFWVVRTRVTDPVKSILDLRECRDQLWAEAVELYHSGESLWLGEKLESMAKEIQEDHTETDDRFKVIYDYLEKHLPENWDEMAPYAKRNYLQGEEDEIGPKVKKHARQTVTIPEIWIECLGCQIKDMNTQNTKPIHDIMKKMPGWSVKKRGATKLFGKQTIYEKV